MVYEELKGKALDSMVYDLFGLHMKKFPEDVVIYLLE